MVTLAARRDVLAYLEKLFAVSQRRAWILANGLLSRLTTVTMKLNEAVILVVCAQARMHASYQSIG
jgi:hypothetical protein